MKTLLNAQLTVGAPQQQLCRFHIVSEIGSELKSRSLSTESERMTHLHIKTHHEYPLETLWVSML